MNFKTPKNSNYSASVVSIKSIIPLEGANTIAHTLIYGNLVIISKDTPVGEKGLFFPVESQISEEFLSYNSLFRDSTKNRDKEKKGFFEDNRRIKALKLMGRYMSQGFFIPLTSLEYISDLKVNDLKEGDIFDEINGKEICRKYVVKQNHTPSTSSKKDRKAQKKHESKLIESQFHFHYDTAQLGRCIQFIKPTDIISCSQKIHGTSSISSKILCKKKLGLKDKIAKFLGVTVVEQVPDFIYASRRVVKNADLNPNAQHYYSVDIWGLAHETLKDFLLEGMTFYYEIVGYLPDGKMIQKGYDYGCDENKFSTYIYRITYTNSTGNVFEFSAKQVQEFCKERGLQVVPELFYGKVTEILPFDEKTQTVEDWQNLLLEELKKRYLEKDCWLNKTYPKSPDEGIVLKIENNLRSEAFKLKSERFYLFETKMLDSGENDIEETGE